MVELDGYQSESKSSLNLSEDPAASLVISLASLEQLANLRHDLRTPVNAIIGYSELLLDELPPAPSPLSTCLQGLQSNGQKLLAAINSELEDKHLRSVLATQPQLEVQYFLGLLQQQINPLLAHSLECIQRCHALVLQMTNLDPDSWDSDLTKIQTAVTRLQTLTEGSDLAAPEPTPSPAASALELPPPATALIRPDLTLGFEGPPAVHPRRTSRILVADDNESNRDLLARYLHHEGYEVSMAGNGRQVLEMVAGGGLDLILLDIRMPEMDGYHVLNALKLNPTSWDLPIIMISAVDEIDSVVRCIEAGAEDFLPKPFNPVLLRARLRACIEKKHLRDLEVDYLKQMSKVSTAAASVEAGNFNPETLNEVANRTDSLGQLARVFQRMAQQVQLREQHLKEQVQQLRIEIDHAKRERQVAEITESDYFQTLRQKIQRLRDESSPST